MEEKLPDAVWEQLRDLSCPTNRESHWAENKTDP